MSTPITFHQALDAIRAKADATTNPAYRQKLESFLGLADHRVDVLLGQELVAGVDPGEMDERYNAGFAAAMEYARWAMPVVVIRPVGGDHWNVESIDGERLSSHETDAQAIAWVRSWKTTLRAVAGPFPPSFCPGCGNQTLGSDGTCRREKCGYGTKEYAGGEETEDGWSEEPEDERWTFRACPECGGAKMNEGPGEPHPSWPKCSC